MMKKIISLVFLVGISITSSTGIFAEDNRQGIINSVKPIKYISTKQEESIKKLITQLSDKKIEAVLLVIEKRIQNKKLSIKTLGIYSELQTLLKKEISSRSADVDAISLLSSDINSTSNEETSIQESKYPGCDLPDIVIGEQTWAACNIGSKKAGETQVSYGSYIQWGKKDNILPLSLAEVKADKLNIGTQPNLWGGEKGRKISMHESASEIDKGLMKGPCETGYHVPTISEFDIALKFVGGTKESLRKKLLIPYAGSKSFGESNGEQYWDYHLFKVKAFLWTSTPIDTTQSVAINFLDSNEAARQKMTFLDEGELSWPYPIEYAASVRCLKNPKE